MKMPQKTIFILLAIGLLLPSLALAKPEVTLAITAEKEVIVEEDGQQVTKRVLARDISPGEIVIYTISYANVGDETATNVAVVDPIPDGTAYVSESATKTGELNFSIDGGKSFQAPTLLTYEVTATDGTKKTLTASPELYTQIRWVIPAIVAGETGALSFQVRTK